MKGARRGRVGEVFAVDITTIVTLLVILSLATYNGSALNCCGLADTRTDNVDFSDDALTTINVSGNCVLLGRSNGTGLSTTNRRRSFACSSGGFAAKDRDVPCALGSNIVAVRGSNAGLIFAFSTGFGPRSSSSRSSGWLGLGNRGVSTIRVKLPFLCGPGGGNDKVPLPVVFVEFCRSRERSSDTSAVTYLSVY